MVEGRSPPSARQGDTKGGVETGATGEEGGARRERSGVGAKNDQKPDRCIRPPGVAPFHLEGERRIQDPKPQILNLIIPCGLPQGYLS